MISKKEYTDAGILFLQQEDVVEAGVLDMNMIVESVEETYAMKGKGELVTPDKLGMHLKEDYDEKFDSFFITMPAFIGGKYEVAGMKWAAESRKNLQYPGIPLGIDVTVLSNPENVMPFCILDGSLITGLRTSATAAVFAKYAAPSFAETATVVGAGVVGRGILPALKVAMPQLKKMYICDIDFPKAVAVANEYSDSLNMEIIPTADGKKAALDSQVIVSATTSTVPFIGMDWTTPGCAVCSVFPAELKEDLITSADALCVDVWSQIQHYQPLKGLKEQGKIKDNDVINLDELILGKKTQRTNDEQFLVSCGLGLGAVDVLIAYKIYEKALELGLGKIVKLWDKPLWE